MTFLQRCLCLFTLVLATACATTPEPDLPEKEYYDKAKSALSNNNYQEAVRQLEALESRYPFGRYAEQALLDLVYARYSSLDPDGAASAADRFIRLHPQSPHVDYAYYIRGLANYYADLSLGARYFPVAMETRDLGRAREAFTDFSQLVTRHPDSPYAADAERRMIAIRNRLAAYELEVARYYIKRDAYVAAAERARYVVERLPETPSVPDALAMMVELYRELGMQSQANDSLSVLIASYPNHPSLGRNQEFRGGNIISQNRSIKGVLTFGLLE
jgi:outer membrane protein assembly factor BamD